MAFVYSNKKQNMEDELQIIHSGVFTSLFFSDLMSTQDNPKSLILWAANAKREQRLSQWKTEVQTESGMHYVSVFMRSATSPPSIMKVTIENIIIGATSMF